MGIAFFVAAMLLADVADVIEKKDLRTYLETTGKQRAIEHWKAKAAYERSNVEAAKQSRIDRRVKQPSLGTTSRNGQAVAIAGTFPSAEAKKAYVAEAEKKLKEAEVSLSDAVPFAPRLPVNQLKVGAVGVPYCPRDRVGLIPDDHYQMTVTQILSPNLAIVSMGELGDIYVRIAVQSPTNGLADGSKIAVGDQCYEVVGTERYSGSTLFKLAPLDIKSFLGEAK
jgi:hypothetical protein